MRTSGNLTREQLIKDLIKIRKHINELQKLADKHEKTAGELIKAQAMYQGLFEFAPDGIVVVNRDGCIVYVNAQAERFFGYGRQEIIDMPVEVLIPERFRQKHIANRQQYFHDPHVRPMGTGLELYGQRKDGSEFPLDISLGPLEFDEGTLVVAVMHDISTWKAMEEELRRSRDELELRVQERTGELTKSQQRLQQLAAQLLMVQEKERKRVALELHDGLLSELGAMKYVFESKLMLLEKGQLSDLNEFKRVSDILAMVTNEARRIMNNLHPSVLDELGLIAAIKWFSGEYQKSYPNIRVQTRLDVSEEDISDSVKIVIYRVLQEALNNFAKHGKGDQVNLSLSRSKSTFVLTIQDNGQGFDMETVRKGLGLESMRERVELSGGEIQIESGLGQGTTIGAIWRL